MITVLPSARVWIFIPFSLNPLLKLDEIAGVKEQHQL